MIPIQPQKNIFQIILGLFFIVGVGIAAFFTGGRNIKDDRVNTIISQEEKEIRIRADEVVASLKSKDIDKFISLVHPIQGIAFDQAITLGKKLTQSEIREHISKNDILFWGIADGSGNRVEETFQEFFSSYLIRDYANAPNITFKEVLRGGSTSPNMFLSQYPDKPFINYFYPFTSTYTDSQTGKEVPNEMSWESLNLVFDKASDGQWYLIGMQIDHWAI